ncbi:hypothetical protein DFH07DRAFT_313350 [Mycena maculata]|uniref:Uncharacterized protein n=1 Tax=Mycena maculata TaxID=230809 RepID=A0AAD7JNK1_9AGAR|nr:hypothetical protein DFH07DRAFT_313350 [Mycena maculata]
MPQTRSRARLGSFIERSSCLLRRLCITGWPDPPPITKILLQHPSIIELVIFIDDSGASPYANDLMSTLTNAALFPHSRFISLGCKDKTSIDYWQYTRMLESRWKAPGSMLQSAALLIQKDPGPDLTTLGRLEKLRRDGLNLQLLKRRDARDVLWGCSYHIVFSPESSFTPF